MVPFIEIEWAHAADGDIIFCSEEGRMLKITLRQVGFGFAKGCMVQKFEIKNLE